MQYIPCTLLMSDDVVWRERNEIRLSLGWLSAIFLGTVLSDRHQFDPFCGDQHHFGHVRRYLAVFQCQRSTTMDLPLPLYASIMDLPSKPCARGPLSAALGGFGLPLSSLVSNSRLEVIRLLVGLVFRETISCASIPVHKEITMCSLVGHMALQRKR